MTIRRYMTIPNFLKKISPTIWQIDTSYKPGMRVPARIIASRELVEKIEPEVYEQLTNVASLPGVINYAYALPDTHSGYGAPVGAVFATDPGVGGIISPGAVGYDINCGVRLLTTALKEAELKPKLKELINNLFREVPAGVGAKSRRKLTQAELDQVLSGGALWCKKKGLGEEDDWSRLEEAGSIPEADPDKVSREAKRRGLEQLGTLGSGNHYLEIQRVVKIFNPELARQFNIFEPGQITIMIHCGSRGLGHQVATDYLRIFERRMTDYDIRVRDRQLACLPLTSAEGQDYYSAMSAAVNFAFANRQAITHQVRDVFEKTFMKGPRELEIKLVYDVCHNIAKKEKHQDLSDKLEKEVLVHRKGATRSFGPGNPKLPSVYRDIGQPVIIGGSMQTGSYLLVGTKRAEELTFGSTSHGAGRVMSRAAAKRKMQGGQIEKEMSQAGIYVRSATRAGLAEEAGAAYKNIKEVIASVEAAGLSRPVAYFEPIGNIKG